MSPYSQGGAGSGSQLAACYLHACPGGGGCTGTFPSSGGGGTGTGILACSGGRG